MGSSALQILDVRRAVSFT